MLPCHRPASSATLSRAVPSSFRQHRSRLRRSNTSCTRGNLLLPLQLQPLSLLVAVGGRPRSHAAAAAFHQAASWSQSQEGRPACPGPCQTRRQAQVQEALRRATRRWRELLIGRWGPHHSLPRRRAVWRIFCFIFVLLLAQQPAVPKTSIKERFPQSLGLKRRRVVYRASRDHFPPPLSPGSGWLPKSTPPAHLWNQVRAVALKSSLEVVIRRAVTSLKPGSCVSTHTRRNQVSVTLHTQTRPCHHRPGRHRPRAGSLCSTSLPHHGYVGDPVGAAGTVSRSLASAPQSVSVAPMDHQTRLCDSVRPASPKFRGIQFISVKAADALVLRAEIAVLLAKDAMEPVPPADMGSGFFSPYFIVPKKSGGLRPILDLPVLNRGLHKLPFKMLRQKRIFGCVRPLDWFAAIDLKDAYFLDPTQAIPAIRVRGSGISVQGPALRAVPVASRLHQSRGGGPCPPERTGCAHSQLPRRLAHTCTVSQAVVCTQGLGAQAPQPAGPSGQLGKEQTRANAEDLFSRHGIGFSQPNSTPHPGDEPDAPELGGMPGKLTLLGSHMCFPQYFY